VASQLLRAAHSFEVKLDWIGASGTASTRWLAPLVYSSGPLHDEAAEGAHSCPVVLIPRLGTNFASPLPLTELGVFFGVFGEFESIVVS
jgi:hypothetical protein